MIWLADPSKQPHRQNLKFHQPSNIVSEGVLLPLFCLFLFVFFSLALLQNQNFMTA